MGRLHSRRGSPRAMLLAGFVLSCIMQAVPAQDSPYLVAKPPIPFVSGSVVLSVQRLPRSFIWCQWYRRTQSVTGEILTYDPQESTKQVNSNAYTGRETVWQNCSLHISQLTQRDTGNYSVEIGVPSQTQQGTQERPDFIEAVFYLQVSALDQTSMKILPRPQNPEPGQDVVLTPQGNPKTFTFCQWSKQTHSGRSEYILSNYFTQQKAPEQERGSAYSGRETLQQDCSLRLGRLTTADTGNYTVELAGPGYWPDQSGQKPNSLEPGDVRVYRAHTYLKIGQQTTAVDQIPITVIPRPQYPEPGQDVYLTPQGGPETYTFCQWSKQTHSGSSEDIIRSYFTQQNETKQDTGSAYSGRETLQPDCSLLLRSLTAADAGNYTVEIQRASKWPRQSEQEAESQEPEEFQVYNGHMYLKIGQQTTGTKPRVSSSASLSYSAAILAGALLGSLAWAETLMALLSMLFGSFASSRPKRLL